MQALRQSRALARLALAWFVLALAAAGLSPVVSPKALELVCSASGEFKMVVIDADGEQVAAGHHGLDCALCLPVTPPPPESPIRIEPDHPLAHALLPAVQAHIASLVGAPLPPRGPPSAA